MKTQEWKTVDKSTWGNGPWQDEPDKRQWKDEATGLPCLIVRGPSGALCGYVGVAEGHSHFGKDYDNAPVEVHGGLTFASKCADMSPAAYAKGLERVKTTAEEAKRHPKGDAAEWLKEWAPHLGTYEAWREQSEKANICHIPGPGEPDHVWWFGFDCAHYQDTTPASDARSRTYGGNYERDGVYRDVAYVTAECTSLAKQLAALQAA